MIKIFQWLIYGHTHKYNVFSVYKYIDGSYNQKMPSAVIASRCDECGKIETEIVYGYDFDTKI